MSMYGARVDSLPDLAQAVDAASMARHFGGRDDLLPLWIAEPYLPPPEGVVGAVSDRAGVGWYGYEARPDLAGVFWDWKSRRQGWAGEGLTTLTSPSIGTSIGAMLELHTEPGEGVILQPPVFTDFKPLVAAAGRMVVKAPLHLADGRYGLDAPALEEAARRARMLILCSPHNPVGRTWTRSELDVVARICDDHDVFVLADEIHSDLVLGGRRFVPFAAAAADTGVRWAATHGPIKTFGIAGLADTFLVTDDAATIEGFSSLSHRLHLNRNNVVGMAASGAGYRDGDSWLDGLLGLVSENVRRLAEGLPEPLSLVEPEATYLAWVDFRALGLDVPDLARWLADEARLALSPGHWFGREGAGFARMTIAVGPEVIDEAISRLIGAVRRL
jgi:cystathionine beta-lyase